MENLDQWNPRRSILNKKYKHITKNHFTIEIKLMKVYY